MGEYSGISWADDGPKPATEVLEWLGFEELSPLKHAQEAMVE
jgi:hypothetical protein